MDRQHLNLPAAQVSLLHAVAAANPSGKLAETSPHALGDTPTFGTFPAVSLPVSAVLRPGQELKGFTKVRLVPGESKRVEIPFNRYTWRHYAAERGASDEEFATLLGLPLPEESPSTGIAADSPLSELRRARSPLARLAI